MPEYQEEELQQKESIAKKQAKKLIRDRVIKVAKKVGKLALKAAANVMVAAAKALFGFLSTIGLPYILAAAAILLIVVLLFVATSMLFANDPDSLDEEALAFREHLIEVSDSTVDMNKEEQIPYRVPFELIIAAMQIYESGRVSPEDAAERLAEALKPIFTYEKYKKIIETETTICTESGCKTTTTKRTVTFNLLVKVEAWDRVVDFDVIPVTTPWVQIGENSRQREHTYETEANVTLDYTLFDRELSKKPFDYGDESKLMVEAIYEILGGAIYYKEWLNGESLIGFEGTVIPGAGVPQEYMAYYLEAEKRYKVDWYIIAAIHYVETKFSTHQPMISSVGAEGHTQFMPCTWLGWSYPGCKGGLGGVKIPDNIKTSPKEIKKYGGLGVDADGDGRADPWNLKDAIFSTANLLSQNGYSSNVDKAIRAYNHSDKYVADVKAKANEFKTTAQYMPGDAPNVAAGTLIRPAAGVKTSPYGQRWGRLHAGVDIAAKKGTPVVSVADGVVSHAACFNPCSKGFGQYVKVVYTIGGKKYEAVYGHLNSIAVTKGQNVTKGQLLGGMGNTGAVVAGAGGDGTHLHFEWHPGGYKGNKSSVNPELMVPI